MSDETNVEAPAAVDPVAAARARLSAEEGSASNSIQGLRRQVRALWITTGVTLVLVVVLAVFSFGPRLFGVRMMGGGSFPQGGPGNFRQGTGQQGGTIQQTTP